mgnify:FL=1
MKTRDSLEIFLKLLSEETKKISKKKKKKSPVAAPILKRPMGTIFFMDAAASLNESAIKPITRKFDGLKWKLNDVQKQFLDDFINIEEEFITEEDLKYASRTTGIPAESIKSIRNTYGTKKTTEQKEAEMKKAAKELGLAGHSLDQNTLDEINKVFTDVRDLPKATKVIATPKPEFRNMTVQELVYRMENESVDRSIERKLPNYIYEWLMYFMEGANIIEIKDSKIMSEIHSTKEGDYHYVMFSFESKENMSGAHPYDVTSNKNLSQLKEFIEKVDEFNETFNTNFKITNQYVGEDNELKVYLENMQIINGSGIKNKKMFDFSVTDRERAAQLGLFDQDGFGNPSEYRSITG